MLIAFRHIWEIWYIFTFHTAELKSSCKYKHYAGLSFRKCITMSEICTVHLTKQCEILFHFISCQMLIKLHMCEVFGSHFHWQNRISVHMPVEMSQSSTTKILNYFTICLIDCFSRSSTLQLLVHMKKKACCTFSKLRVSKQLLTLQSPRIWQFPAEADLSKLPPAWPGCRLTASYYWLALYNVLMIHFG